MAVTRKPITISSATLPLTNDQILTLPADLRQALTSALFTSPASIPAIQDALSTSTSASGFSKHLESYIFDLLRQDPNHIPTEAEVLTAVLESVRKSTAETRKEKDPARTARTTQQNGKVQLAVPQSIMDAGTKSVKKELGNIGVKIEDDEEDWT